MKLQLTFEDRENLRRKLMSISNFDLESVKQKQLVQMQNRSKKKGKSGATPVAPNTKKRKGGQLRLSILVNNDEIGYSKDYAPHVEYGHRTVNGGYVVGQRFLRKNKEIQEKIYLKDILKKLKED